MQFVHTYCKISLINEKSLIVLSSAEHKDIVKIAQGLFVHTICSHRVHD